MGHIWKPLGSVITRLIWKTRKRNTKFGHTINVQKNAYCLTNKILMKKNVKRYVISWNTRNRIGPIVDENKLQFDKKNNKNWKFGKIFQSVDQNFKIIRYKLTALGNINHSILNYKAMRPVINLRLPKEQKQQIQEKDEREKSRRH